MREYQKNKAKSSINHLDSIDSILNTDFSVQNKNLSDLAFDLKEDLLNIISCLTNYPNNSGSNIINKNLYIDLYKEILEENIKTIDKIKSEVLNNENYKKYDFFIKRYSQVQKGNNSFYDVKKKLEIAEKRKKDLLKQGEDGLKKKYETIKNKYPLLAEEEYLRYYLEHEKIGKPLDSKLLLDKYRKYFGFKTKKSFTEWTLLVVLREVASLPYSKEYVKKLLENNVKEASVLQEMNNASLEHHFQILGENYMEKMIALRDSLTKL